MPLIILGATLTFFHMESLYIPMKHFHVHKPWHRDVWNTRVYRIRHNLWWFTQAGKEGEVRGSSNERKPPVRFYLTMQKLYFHLSKGAPPTLITRTRVLSLPVLPDCNQSVRKCLNGEGLEHVRRRTITFLWDCQREPSAVLSYLRQSNSVWMEWWHTCLTAAPCKHLSTWLQ